MCDMKLSNPVMNPFICIQILMYFLYALKNHEIVARVNLQTHRYFLAQYSWGRTRFVSSFIVFDRTGELKQQKEQSTYIFFILKFAQHEKTQKEKKMPLPKGMSVEHSFSRLGKEQGITRL